MDGKDAVSSQTETGLKGRSTRVKLHGWKGCSFSQTETGFKGRGKKKTETTWMERMQFLPKRKLVLKEGVQEWNYMDGKDAVSPKRKPVLKEVVKKRMKLHGWEGCCFSQTETGLKGRSKKKTETTWMEREQFLPKRKLVLKEGVKKRLKLHGWKGCSFFPNGNWS